MRFQIPAFSAAIVMTGLVMGILGIAVLLPIACIQWTWNSVVTTCGYGSLPTINAWQASLLYLAVATSLWLSGLVRIEFELDQ